VRRFAILLALACLAFVRVAERPVTAASDTIKVATWNVRSGMGIAGFGTRNWRHDTLNCTDRTKPMNAWGMGLPQRELERIKTDPKIIALAVQEAWNCGSPKQLNSVLGFKTPTRQRNGVGLIARHGLNGSPIFQRVGAGYDSWLVGGSVCVDQECSATLPLFSTHWGGSDAEWPLQAQNVLTFLNGQPEPHLFMGDLNVFRIDRWNPRVPCTNTDKPGRSRAIALIEQAGYVDAWKATQSGEGWTGMASREDCGSPEGNLYKRIDYIYVKGLRVISSHRFAKAAPGADAPSDHAGIIAELAFSTPTTRDHDSPNR
jgi:hypothetical protein